MVSFLGKKNLLEFEVTEIMFQQYFSYIMIVGLIGRWNSNTRENHRPDVSQWLTLVVSTIPQYGLEEN
jgi:hypothetical protein